MIKFKERSRRGRWLYRAICTHKIMKKNSVFTLEASKLEDLATHHTAESSQLTDPAGVGPKSKDNDICSSPQTVQHLQSQQRQLDRSQRKKLRAVSGCSRSPTEGGGTRIHAHAVLIHRGNAVFHNRRGNTRPRSMMEAWAVKRAPHLRSADEVIQFRSFVQGKKDTFP